MLGDKIKELRAKNGLNQTQFGKRIFVTPGAVSQWEKGLTRPDTERLLLIAKEFGVPLDYFNDTTREYTYHIFQPSNNSFLIVYPHPLTTRSSA